MFTFVFFLCGGKALATAWVNFFKIYSLFSNPVRMEENQELGSVKGVQEPIGMPKIHETGKEKDIRL